MTRSPIEKGKSPFQPVTTTVFTSAKVPSSLSSISLSRKPSPVITDFINPRLDVFGPEYRNIMFGGGDLFRNLENRCFDMYKAFRTYFSVTVKIFVMNCY